MFTENKTVAQDIWTNAFLGLLTLGQTTENTHFIMGISAAHLTNFLIYNNLLSIWHAAFFILVEDINPKFPVGISMHNISAPWNLIQNTPTLAFSRQNTISAPRL